MFDAAAVATAAEVNQEQVAQEQAESAVSNDGMSGSESQASVEGQVLLQAIASYSPGETPTEIAFVDPTVPDYQSLIAGMGPNVQIVMLDGGQDGMEQIAASLAGRTGIDAIHIISHGAEGQLSLGTGTLTQTSMAGQYADELATIKQSLSESADILVYGCNFAAGQAGQDAATLLGQLTGADVAASIDDTGYAGLGGDWDLELQIGTIETQVAIDYDTQADWVGLLSLTASGSETRVNTTTTGTQTHNSPDTAYTPDSVAMDASGNYVSVWESAGNIVGQRFNSAGTAQGGEFVIASNAATERLASVDMNASGQFVVTWERDQGTGDTDIYARVYNASGTAIGSEFLVNETTTYDQEQARVAMASDGTFVVVWESNHEAGTYYDNIYAQRYDATGTKIGSNVLVNTTTAGDQSDADIAMDSAGNFVVVWAGERTAGSSAYSIYGQRYNSSGVAQSGEFLVNSVASSNDQHASVAMNDSGNFVVTWDRQSGGDSDIQAQRFNSSGVAQGSALSVTNTASYWQDIASVAMDGGGNFVVSWSSSGQDGSGFGVYSRQYDSTGTALTTESQTTTTTSGEQDFSGIAYSNGKVVVTWSGNGTGDTTGIFMQRYNVAGGNAAPTITSNGGGLTAAINVAENTTAVTTVTATDADAGATLTYSISGGADAAKFTINSSTGVLSFISAPNYESPSDSGGNNVYDVLVTVKDNNGGADTQSLSVTVTNVNDAPTITSLSGDSLSYSEGSGAVVIEQGGNALVADVDSTNFDTGTLTVSIPAGGDSAEDVLSIRNQGTSAGQIGVSGSTITYGGTTIGTFTGGSSASALVITLNSNATPTAVTALVQNITYENTDTNAPTTGARTVRYVLTDGDGGASANYDTTVTVSETNDAPTFAVGDGIVTTDIGSSFDVGRSITVQADGKVLVAGYGDSGGNWDFAVTRYNPDGSLDTSFGGGDGKVTTAVGAFADYGQSVTVQADGKILVAGYSFNGTNWDFAVVRYNADGTLDTTFGGGTGRVTTAIGPGDDIVYSVTVQADGKILVAGTSNNNFALARYHSDGTLDTSFSGDGIVTTDLGGWDTGASVTVQADGKILVAGSRDSGGSDFALVRYNADGTLDTTFGGGTGEVTTAIGPGTDYGRSVVVQADGKILVGGVGSNGSNNDFAVVRYNVDGTLDTTFGGGTGTVTTAIGTGNDSGNSVAVQADGKILVGGHSSNGSNNDFAVVRYNVDGTLDTTFGGGTGTVTTAIGPGDDYGRSVVVQADGKILVGGYSSNGSNDDFALVRYNADGTLDTQFAATTNSLGGTVAYTEGGTPAVLDSDVQVFDAELSGANNFNEATLTLVRNGGANAEDVFSATGTLSSLSAASGNVVIGGTTIGTYTNSGGMLVFTFNASATNMLVNSAMQQIAYSNSSDAPPSSVQVNWAFSDGNSGAQGSGGALEANGSVTVSITAVNDAPVLADTVLSLTVAEDAGVPGGAVGSLVSAFTGGITDVDSGASKGLAITGSNETNGTWYYTTNGGTTWTAVGAVSSASSLLLADNGSTRLYFSPSANYNGTSSAALTVRVWDQTSGTTGTKVSTASNGGTTAFSSATDTIDVTVSGVNDAPTDLALAGNTVAENAANGTVVGTVSGTDPDSGDTKTYSFTDSAGGRFAINSSTGQITVADGSLLNYEAATSHSVIVRVTDAGGLTYDETFTINLTNVNEAPIGADATVTITEDTAHTVTPGNVGFSDVDAGDSLSAVRIDTLLSAGSLTLSGVVVTAGQVVSVADITAGNLVFTPAANANGMGYASFTFSVRDSNNVYDVAPNTLTFNVTAVNDVPTVAVNSGSTVAEGGTDTIDSSELAVTDVDHTAAQLTYSIGTSPAYGRLELTTVPGVSATTFTQADIAANRLVYVHDGSETTSDNFTFTVGDGAGGTLGTTTMTLTITPVNDTPTITSDGGASTAMINVVENVSAVTIVTGADVDLPAQALNYSISGGTDQALFTINAATGALSFTAPPNFEVATDANGDNIYVVQVRVTDGQGASTTQMIQVTVTDVAEGLPLIPPVLLPTTPSSPTGPGSVPSSPSGPPVQTTDVPPPLPSGSGPSASPPEFTPTSAAPSETERLNPIGPEEPRKTIDVAKDSALFHWIDEARRLLLTGIPMEATPTPESEPAEQSQSVSDLLFSKLDEMTASLEQAMGVSQEQHAITARIAALTGTTLSAGFIAWALRSGTLLASFMATMPAWRHFDPLPVLGGSRSERDRRRKEAEQDRQAEDTEFKGLKHLLDLGPPLDPKP